MGGVGSGRKSEKPPIALDEIPKLSMRDLRISGFVETKKAGHLTATSTLNQKLHLFLDVSSDTLTVKYQDYPPEYSFRINTQKISCHFGGSRSYFKCSGKVQACNYRCEVLYCLPTGPVCRKCADLLYASQRNPAHIVALQKVQTLRSKLGGTLIEPLIPDKPSGMRENTYFKLSLQIFAAWEKYDLLESRYRQEQLLRLVASPTQRTGCASGPAPLRVTQGDKPLKR